MRESVCRFFMLAHGGACKRLAAFGRIGRVQIRLSVLTSLQNSVGN